MIDIPALLAVVDAATEGEWVYVGQGCYESYVGAERVRGCAEDAEDMVDPIIGVHRFKDEYADADFIATFNPVMVRELLVELQGLRDGRQTAHAGENTRCLCDGGSYEVKAHPFIVNPDCQIHGDYDDMHLQVRGLS